MAFDAFNLLANGMGGIDWAGLPVVAEVLGVADVERLVTALYLIKTHKPERPEAPRGDPSAGENDGTGHSVY